MMCQCTHRLSSPILINELSAVMNRNQSHDEWSNTICCCCSPLLRLCARKIAAARAKVSRKAANRQQTAEPIVRVQFPRSGGEQERQWHWHQGDIRSGNVFQHYFAADHLLRWIFVETGKLTLTLFFRCRAPTQSAVSFTVFFLSLCGGSQKYFFRNLGAILTFAIVGTTVSALLIGSLMYGAIRFLPGKLEFTFLDTLYFGALISPTVSWPTSHRTRRRAAFCAKSRKSHEFFDSIQCTGPIDDIGHIQCAARRCEPVCAGVWRKCFEWCRCHCDEQVRNERGLAGRQLAFS